MQKTREKARVKTREEILVISKNPYTETEWRKIEKLSKAPGKIYKSATSAKKHISALVKPSKTIA